MAVYLLINATFLLTLPIELLAGNLNAASDTSKILFGENGGKIITIEYQFLFMVRSMAKPPRHARTICNG